MLSLQNGFIFLIDNIFSLYLLAIWLRLYLQYRAANFHNPICQLIIKVTNPLIIPLRRFVPSIKKIDTSSAILLYLVAIIEIILISITQGTHAIFSPEFISAALLVAVINVIKVIINSFFWGVFI